MAGRMRRVAAVVGALVTAGAVMFVLGAGAGPLPALGVALDPGQGVWASADDARLPHSEQLRLPGLTRPVDVSFTSGGVASIRASSDADLFLAQGYVAARFRLSQLDLERRLGEGRLAQLNGASSVASDRFELTLGLRRNAEAEWRATPPASPAGQALLAYAKGVNDRLAELDADHRWPAVYPLAGVRPAPWTPVDSLVVQGVLTQQLDFSTSPLDYAILSSSLGARRTSQWFPVLPANQQHPYDPGPYRNLGTAPITEPNTDATAPTAAGTRPAADRPPSGAPDVTPATAQAASAVLGLVTGLPAGARHLSPDSNAWAVNGPSVGAGQAVLAGDPHLQLSLPSIWYQVSLRSPGLDVTGASLPGMPAVLLGHNQHISWSLTDVQNQSTFYYREQTSPAHPNAYFWKGGWRRMEEVPYEIPVRGGRTVRFDARLTVHGPLLTSRGRTTAVDWMGDLPSPDLAALLSVDTATDWTQFRGALRDWHAPTQNFVFADDRGNIGAISPGYYPQIAAGDPRAPLPGTGASDLTGTIPFAAVPQVYDPPGHVVATANQRPVGDGYPYYIGFAQDYDPGYRAATIAGTAGAARQVGLPETAALQTGVTDHLAGELVPELLDALKGARLDRRQQEAEALLAGWNDSMDASSPAASVWWTFWGKYLTTTFGPWWSAARVPVSRDRAALDLTRADSTSLMEDLEDWTLRDPTNPAFTPPGHSAATAADAMRQAFTAAVADLSQRLGPQPAEWRWGRLHRRVVPSLTAAAPLGYGPLPAGGDPWTVNAADDGLTSDFGPSWRMVVDWTGSGRATAEAVYPGGQSENPASPWYDNFVGDWWSGRYRPLLTADRQSAGGVRWTLRPGR